MSEDFHTFGLAPAIVDAVRKAGYTVPTPIQRQAIPAILAGRDVRGIAATGTGKTAAFALPILHRLLSMKTRAPAGTCRALILSPTRELASQIAQNVRAYGRHTGLRVSLVHGGVPRHPDARRLKGGTDILVATPGRLLDHLSDGAILLRNTEILVLDEADHMLDLGFIQPIRTITALTASNRQTLLFSATMPGEIGRLAERMLNDPVLIGTAAGTQAAGRIEQRLVFVQAAEKRHLLAALLRKLARGRILVFTRTKQGADGVAAYLDRAGLTAAAIHGDKSQTQRERSLAAFREGRVDILVATDLAARGIDIDGVSHVINFELPHVPETYVHRIGRTARAGGSGMAISLCDAGERSHLREIEKLIRRRLTVCEPGQLAAQLAASIRGEAPQAFA